MISKATQRVILRWFHLILTIPLAGIIYGDVSNFQQYVGGVRLLFFPAMLFSGLSMWRGYLFGIIGATLWLAAFRLSGIGAAFLSQIVLFIGMKIWLVVRGRKSKAFEPAAH